MTYVDELGRIEQTFLCELFLIYLPDGQYYCYTTGDVPVSYQGRTYTPSSIQRSDFTYDTALKSVKVTISGSVLNPMSQFIASAPFLPVELTITRCYTSDPDTLARPIYFGELRVVKIKDMVMTAEFISDRGIFDKEMPRIYFQNDCNHFLFDNNCTLNEGDYLIEGIVDGVDEDGKISIPASANPDANYYVGGIVIFGSEHRMITAFNVAGIITPVFPFSGIAVGDTVQVLPGCNGTPSVCINRFNNFAHFVGFPYMPYRNIMIWGFK